MPVRRRGLLLLGTPSTGEMVRGNDSVPKAPPGRVWDARQRAFLQRARLWSSTAVLEEAGCGKSTALIAAVSLWRTGRDASEVVILCPMKKAAEEWADETGLNVLTIHGFFCVGPQPLTANALRTAARRNPMVLARIRACITLILDEVQAISMSTFEAIAAVFAEYALPGCPAGARFRGRRMYGESATYRGLYKLVESRYPLTIFFMLFPMFCVSLLGATQHAGTRCNRDLAEKTSKGRLCGTTCRSYPSCGRSPSTKSILIDGFVAVMLEV
jgi:AAA domain